MHHNVEVATARTVASSSSNSNLETTTASSTATTRGNYGFSGGTSGDSLMDDLQRLLDVHESTSRTADQQQLQHDPSASCCDIEQDAERGILLLAPISTHFSPLKTTRILNQLLHCFVMGGECHLALPQLSALVFGDIPLPLLEQGMARLYIRNRMATKEQLDILKLSGVVPASLPNCELISKSNAERLVGILLPTCSGTTGSQRNDDDAEGGVASDTPREHILVEHECFGGCTGLLYYATPASIPCVECSSCGAMFTAENFCRHSHLDTGRQSHWGFDLSNWLFYMHPITTSAADPDRDEQIWMDFVNAYLRGRAGTG